MYSCYSNNVREEVGFRWRLESISKRECCFTQQYEASTATVALIIALYLQVKCYSTHVQEDEPTLGKVYYKSE